MKLAYFLLMNLLWPRVASNVAIDEEEPNMTRVSILSLGCPTRLEDFAVQIADRVFSTYEMNVPEAFYVPPGFKYYWGWNETSEEDSGHLRGDGSQRQRHLGKVKVCPKNCNNKKNALKCFLNGCECKNCGGRRRLGSSWKSYGGGAYYNGGMGYGGYGGGYRGGYNSGGGYSSASGKFHHGSTIEYERLVLALNKKLVSWGVRFNCILTAELDEVEDEDLPGEDIPEEAMDEVRKGTAIIADGNSASSASSGNET
jgi:hypothetical protein